MIINKIKSAIDLAKNLRTTGAINQTSRKCEKAICAKLSAEPNKIYVEFGAGPGNITKEILSRIHPSSELYTFEVNENFCQNLSEKIKDERLHIINDSASKLAEYVVTPADGVISSLPLTILPKNVRLDILAKAYDHMKTESYFSQIMYSSYMKSILYKQFDDIEHIRLFSFPIENIYYCLKK